MTHDDKAKASLTEHIRRRMRRYDGPGQRRIFVGLLLEPPVCDTGDGVARDRRTREVDAFWRGYDGHTMRPPLDSDRAASFGAGRLRRELERKGRLPVSCGFEIAADGTLQPATAVSPFLDEPGYITHRKEAAGADFVLYDRRNGGDWIDAEDRWVVARYLDGQNTGIVSFGTRSMAMDVLRDVAAGRETGIDFGEEDGAPRP